MTEDQVPRSAQSIKDHEDVPHSAHDLDDVTGPDWMLGEEIKDAPKVLEDPRLFLAIDSHRSSGDLLEVDLKRRLYRVSRKLKNPRISERTITH